jgi:N-acetylneuraminic acid mutarotase
MGSSGAVAFTIQGKGYVGTGSGAGGTGKDFWEYDPASDSWTQKADLVGSPVSYATGFALNGKGYIGSGVVFGNGDFLKTFYEYDPALDKWTRKADFPGFAVDQAVGFSIGDLGYIGMGLRWDSWLGQHQHNRLMDRLPL